MADTSKYREVCETLRTEILSGKYSASSVLPSALALAGRFHTTRATVRRALDRLRNDGFVGCRRGAGTFVTKAARSRKIGLIVPGVAYSEFYMPFLSAINRLAGENGYTLLLGEVYSKDPRARVRQVRTLAQKFADEDVAGIVYQPFELLSESDTVNRDILSVFDVRQIPVVLVASDVVPSPDRSAYDLVGINDFEAGRRLALHLREVGVRRVAFLLNEYSNYSVQNRLVGMRSVYGGVRELAEVHFDPADQSAVRRLLSGRNAPDAIVCRSDAVAARLVVALRPLGKRVPDDVLLAGFNDIGYAATLDLTSVRVPSADIAALAFRALQSRMVDPSALVQSHILPAPLTVRHSTERPAAKRMRVKR